MASTNKWNRSGGGERRPRTCSRLSPMWIAVAILAVSGVVAWWAFSTRESARPSDGSKRQPPSMIAEVKPNIATNVVVETSKLQPVDPSAHLTKKVVSSVVTTNASGAVIEKIVFADGTKKMKVHPPKPIFDNACDQVIALAIGTKPGEAMPPLPDLNGIDEDFAKSLLNPIRIKDDDSEEVKELKRNVIEAKKQIRELVKGGKSVMEALQEHQAEMEKIESSRLVAIREMQRINAEDGQEMAQEFAMRVNEDFEDRGIPAIPVIGTSEKSQRRDK